MTRLSAIILLGLLAWLVLTSVSEVTATPLPPSYPCCGAAANDCEGCQKVGEIYVFFPAPDKIYKCGTKNGEKANPSCNNDQTWRCKNGTFSKYNDDKCEEYSGMDVFVIRPAKTGCAAPPSTACDGPIAPPPPPN